MPNVAARRTFDCTLCARSFATLDARQAHVASSPIHPRCEPCGRSFLNNAALEAHRVDAPAHHYCRDCEREFPTASGLRQHRAHAAVHLFDSTASSDSDDDRMPPLETATDSDEEAFVTGSESDYGDDGSGDEGFGNGWGFPPRGHTARPRLAEEQELADAAEMFFRMTFEEHMARRVDNFLNGAPRSRREDVYSSDSGEGESSGSDEDNSSDYEDASSADDRSEASGSEPSTPWTPSDATRSTRTPLFSSPHPRPAEGATPSPANTSTSISSSGTLADSKSAEKLPPDVEVETATGAGAKVSRTTSGGVGYTCPLCLEQGDDLSSVKCGHVFCTGCIKTALETKRQCPICRQSAKMRHIRRIYLST